MPKEERIAIRKEPSNKEESGLSCQYLFLLKAFYTFFIFLLPSTLPVLIHVNPMLALELDFTFLL